MRPPTGSLVYSRAAWDRAPARQGQRLTASLTLAPACLRLPLAWSARPSVRRRRLPVSRPAVFLKAPLTAWALCAIFLEILIGGCLSGVIPRTRARWRGCERRAWLGGAFLAARRVA